MRRWTLGMVLVCATGAVAPCGADEVWPAVDVETGKPAISGLLAGDWLQTDVAARFGFATEPAHDPLSFQVTTRIDVVESGAGYLLIDAGVRVASVRYAGTDLAFVLTGDAGDGSGAPDAWSTLPVAAPKPVITGNPRLDDLADRQRRVALAVASLDGSRVRALVTPGRDPWISLVTSVEGGELPELERVADEAVPSLDVVTRDVVMRALLLVTFPPVPRDLDPDADRTYIGGGARHQVLGAERARFPIRGVEARVRALDATSFARAFYAFEAINELGFVPTAHELDAREQADVHPALGVATWRRVDATSRFGAPEGDEIVTRARWTAWLSGASVQSAPEPGR